MARGGGNQFLFGFVVGALIGPWVIGIVKDVAGSVINMVTGAFSGAGTQVTNEYGYPVGTGYSGTEKEASWVNY